MKSEFRKKVEPLPPSLSHLSNSSQVVDGSCRNLAGLKCVPLHVVRARYQRYCDLRIPVGINLSAGHKKIRLHQPNLSSDLGSRVGQNEKRANARSRQCRLERRETFFSKLQAHNLHQVALTPTKINEALHSTSREFNVDFAGGRIQDMVHLPDDDRSNALYDAACNDTKQDFDCFVSLEPDDHKGVDEVKSALNALVENLWYDQYECLSDKDKAQLDHEVKELIVNRSLKNRFVHTVEFEDQPLFGDHYYTFKLGKIDVSAGYSRRRYRFGHEAFVRLTPKQEVETIPYEGTLAHARWLYVNQIIDTNDLVTLNPYMLLKYWMLVADGWIPSRALSEHLYATLQMHYLDSPESGYVERLVDQYLIKVRAGADENRIISMILSSVFDSLFHVSCADLIACLHRRLLDALNDYVADRSSAWSILVRYVTEGSVNDVKNKMRLLVQFSSSSRLSVHQFDCQHRVYEGSYLCRIASASVEEASPVFSFSLPSCELDQSDPHQATIAHRLICFMANHEMMATPDAVPPTRIANDVVLKLDWKDVMKWDQDPGEEKDRYLKFLPVFTNFSTFDERQNNRNLLYMLESVLAIEEGSDLTKNASYCCFQAHMSPTDKNQDSALALIRRHLCANNASGGSNGKYWVSHAISTLRAHLSMVDEEQLLEGSSQLDPPAWLDQLLPSSFIKKSLCTSRMVSTPSVNGDSIQLDESTQPSLRDRSKQMKKKKKLKKNFRKSDTRLQEISQVRDEVLEASRSRRSVAKALWKTLSNPKLIALASTLPFAYQGWRSVRPSIGSCERDELRFHDDQPRASFPVKSLSVEVLIDTLVQALPYTHDEHLGMHLSADKVRYVEQSLQHMEIVRELLKIMTLSPANLHGLLDVLYHRVAPGRVLEQNLSDDQLREINTYVHLINEATGSTYRVEKVDDPSWCIVYEPQTLSTYLSALGWLPETQSVADIQSVFEAAHAARSLPVAMEVAALIEGGNAFDAQMIAIERTWRGYGCTDHKLVLMPALFHDDYPDLVTAAIRSGGTGIMSTGRVDELGQVLVTHKSLQWQVPSVASADCQAFERLLDTLVDVMGEQKMLGVEQRLLFGQFVGKLGHLTYIDGNLFLNNGNFSDYVKLAFVKTLKRLTTFNPDVKLTADDVDRLVDLLAVQAHRFYIRAMPMVSYSYGLDRSSSPSPHIYFSRQGERRAVALSQLTDRLT